MNYALIWLLMLGMLGPLVAYAQTGLPIAPPDGPPAPAPTPPDTSGWEEDALDYRPQWLNLDAIYPQIRYPTEARDAGIRGKVLVRVLVDSTGAYVMHRIVRTPHALLTGVVEPLLPQLRSEPPRRNARHVRAWRVAVFKFDAR